MSQTVIETQRDYIQNILSGIDGVKKVYFQPPKDTQLAYPCIIYSLDGVRSNYANGQRYLTFPSYSLTLIDYDTESIIQKYLLDLTGDCHISFDRFYTSDNLNHWVYTLSFSKALW